MSGQFDQERDSVLGGDVTRRGLLSFLPVSRESRIAVAVVALVGLLVVISGGASWQMGLAGLLVAVLTWWFAWPSKNSPRSRLDRLVVRGRRRRRQRAHLHEFTRLEEVVSARAPQALSAWQSPPCVGLVEPVDFSGTRWAESGLFVLVHTNRGEQPFLTVMMSTSGQSAGLWTDAQHARAQAGFGALLADVAKDSRWITDLCQLSRTLPQDLTEHVAAMADAIAAPGLHASEKEHAVFQTLLHSYGEVVETAKAVCEDHRNLLVARIDLTDQFVAAAARVEPGPGGWAKLVRDELHEIRRRAPRAGLGRVEVLGERRTVAAIRALQNPDFRPDEHGGLSWADAFRSYTSTRRELLVDGRWWTRIAIITPASLEAARLGPRFLAPLLVELEPSVERTVATRLHPVSREIARDRAAGDKTSDIATARTRSKHQQVDDGTDEAMMNASARRLADLKPDSGHAGLEWTLALAVQCRSRDQLEDACRAVDSAAADCSIRELDWLPDEQDLAWSTVLGLGRGMAA